MTTEQLSMSMFAARADYDAAVQGRDEDESRAPVVTGSPDTIWLCYGDIDRDATHRECVEVMWCEDKQDQSDVRYVRADLADAEHSQRVTLQPHAAYQARRIADLEAKCCALERMHDAAADERDALREKLAEIEAEVKRITECGRAHIRRAADFEVERNTARGAVRELERQLFALQHQRDVLQTCLDRHQRDAGDPPGYLQDAVIRAAGLGALHTERDAAIKERDALRTRLAEIEAQEPVAKIHTDGYWTARRGYDPLSDGKAFLSVYARPVPAQAVPDGWRLVPADPTPDMLDAARSQSSFPLGVYRAMIAAAPEHKA